MSRPKALTDRSVASLQSANRSGEASSRRHHHREVERDHRTDYRESRRDHRPSQRDGRRDQGSHHHREQRSSRRRSSSRSRSRSPPRAGRRRRSRSRSSSRDRSRRRAHRPPKTSEPPPKSVEQIKKEEAEKAEEDRKLKLGRVLRARLAHAQLKLDLEMENAQDDYDRQKATDRAGLANQLDEDDIQMPDGPADQVPIARPEEPKDEIVEQLKFKELDDAFKKPAPPKVDDRLVKISLSFGKTPSQKPAFSNAFSKFSKLNTTQKKPSVFSKPPVPAEPQRAPVVEQRQPEAAAEEDEVDPLDAFMLEINPEAVQQETFSVKPEPVITFEDFTAGNQEAADSEAEADDAEFHKEFLKKMKHKAQQDTLATQSNELLINDDEDKFMRGLEKADTAGVGFVSSSDQAQEREKKREAKKDLKFYDGQNIQYDKINKNLYIESVEISNMTTKEVQDFRRSYGDIKVRGLQCPRPIQNWYQCGLPAPILDLIEKKQFERPFAIQSQAIPVGMSGRDLIGIAETGSGKTLAYVLPMIRHIRDQRPIADGDGPIGLVIAPTRELVLQIYKETRMFAKACGLTVVPIYGGVNVQDQLPQLKRGCEIVVCTPGRMRDVLALSNGKITNLKRVSYVVLDEADRILDMGFEPQIKVMLQNCRPDKQTVLFSATFPRSIETLARSILIHPIEIVVGNRGQTSQNIEQTVEILEEDDKFWRLMELLGEWQEKGSILIFVDKQIEADDLFKELYKVGYQAIVLHGGQDQIDREGFIQDFKDNVRNIMVATSLCARGLDISHIKLVVNYCCPNHIEDYVHRVGRTGRAGNQGTAVTFITPDECQYAQDLITALENSNKKVPDDLKELHDEYLQKVKDGEIDKKRANIGFIGKGFKFDAEEENKIKELRMELSKEYGFAVDNDKDENEIDLNKEDQEKLEQNEKQEQYLLLKLLDKDDNARKIALEAGNRASREALKQGHYSSEQVAEMAKQEMIKALKDFKPAHVTAERALDKATKIRDMYIDEENQREGIFTFEVEINDLQPMIRGKIQSRDFISSIAEMTSCKISNRGQFVEDGKKPAVGVKKQHLYIEGTSKQSVANAYNEIKRQIDELQMAQSQMINRSYTEGFSGQFGKF